MEFINYENFTCEFLVLKNSRRFLSLVLFLYEKGNVDLYKRIIAVIKKR